ncbi:hypothetical protein [Undibacterium fentianense]|uniref:Uncharacterized protein n=1 Tax=Undibacterium fentianense TaxID=2828728 RepID=A0A941IE14_9BURK|nr:hypothetical protein [Undibacterium fentianense]MBR7799156.1 hypothetical protein [Undibacterium fentianense]
MSAAEVFDYRDEFYLKTFRRWYVIKLLCSNKKFVAGVPLQKAGFVDFLICNPLILRKFLMHFDKAAPSLNLDDLLYKDNIDSDGGQDITDFSRTCTLLISQGHIKFMRQEGEIFLVSNDVDFSVASELANRWKKEIDLIQPLLGKSLAVLSTGILRG